MSNLYTYREMEDMGLGLITLDWIDLTSLATAFGWRPSTIDGGIDLEGRRRPSLVDALERARATLIAAPEERAKMLQLDTAGERRSDYETAAEVREMVISDYLTKFEQEACISNVDEFIEAVQDWSRRGGELRENVRTTDQRVLERAVMLCPCDITVGSRRRCSSVEQTNRGTDADNGTGESSPCAAVIAFPSKQQVAEQGKESESPATSPEEQDVSTTSPDGNVVALRPGLGTEDCIKLMELALAFGWQPFDWQTDPHIDPVPLELALHRAKSVLMTDDPRISDHRLSAGVVHGYPVVGIDTFGLRSVMIEHCLEVWDRDQLIKMLDDVMRVDRLRYAA
jgi:hypothetical protein